MNRYRPDLDNFLTALKPLIDGACEVLGIDDKMLAPLALDYGDDVLPAYRDEFVSKYGLVLMQLGSIEPVNLDSNLHSAR